MKTILIAGAGQLGSRHLQGVKTSKYDLDIWVYDLNDESLQVASERYNQVMERGGVKNVHYCKSLGELPSGIDVAIVATSSKPRCSIVTNLLGAHQVKYLILEKFLFPSLSEYDQIGNLIKENQVKAWVNCPRRMWEGYEYINTLIDKTKPVKMHYTGGEWGMCCNTIHFVDIFMYLSGDQPFDVCIDNLEKEVVDSKRQGYVELHGEELFETTNGSLLTLVSRSSISEDSAVSISNGNLSVEYREGKGEIQINGEQVAVPVHYQSGLSGILIDELLATGNCRLSTYLQSAEYHKIYLRKIGPFINKIKGWTSDACPIT